MHTDSHMATRCKPQALAAQAAESDARLALEVTERANEREAAEAVSKRLGGELEESRGEFRRVKAGAPHPPYTRTDSLWILRGVAVGFLLWRRASSDLSRGAGCPHEREDQGGN
jgi:hypothetical protein